MTHDMAQAGEALTTIARISEAGDVVSADGRRKGSGLFHWLTDFEWRDGAIFIRKTNISLKVSRAVIAEIANWAVWLAILNIGAVSARLFHAERRTIHFQPDCPRPWYLVRAASMWAGFAIARDTSQAHATVYFDDSTMGSPPRAGSSRTLNFACTDISKSHVARVFEEVFGYPLTVDPRKISGEIVEKPEKNGVHGGRLVQAPLAPRDGQTYQRVVNTLDNNGCCHDLRTPCAGGVPILVWVKVKSPQGRFSINNKSARLAAPDAIFSPTEIASIKAFNARMGLDWGGLDILRDRDDGRIYIVDVNKTDLGPVIALSWYDKVVSVTRLAGAFRALVDSPSRAC